MSARILDGKARAARLSTQVAKAVAARVAAGKSAPGLAVVLVGDNAASQVYVRNKRRTTDSVGLRSFAHDLPANVSQNDLVALVRSEEHTSELQSRVDLVCRLLLEK